MDFWLWVSRLGSLVSFVALGGVAAASTQWWARVRREDRRRQRDAELAAGRGRKPIALAIFFEGPSIGSDVRTYLSGRFPTWSFPALPLGATDPDSSPRRWPIVEFEHGGVLSPDVAVADIARLRQVEHWLKEEGYDEVHLFMRSTVAFGCAIGSLFTNWGAVHVYHHSPPYEHWFSLDEVKRLAPPPALGDVIATWAAQGLDARRRRQVEAPASAPNS